MPIKFSKSKTLPVGVDVGTSMVKLAQLRLTEEKTELIAAGAAAIPAAFHRHLPARMDFLSKAIRQIFRNNQFKGVQSILSIPAETTVVQHIRLPKLPREETVKAIHMELQGKLTFAVGVAVIRHIVAGEVFGDGDPKQEVVVVAVARQTIDNYLAMAAKAKLDVIGINIEACAVVECFSRLFRRASDADRAVLFLDIGDSSTQVVLSRGDKIAFARNLPLGGMQLDQAVADGLHIPLEQAHSMRVDMLKGGSQSDNQDQLYRLLDRPVDLLADELTQCLRYYESVFRNQGVERAIFVGGQAYDKRLCQAIAQRLNLPAQIGDPLLRIDRMCGAGLEIGLDRREPQPDWAVAIGLSLGAERAA